MCALNDKPGNPPRIDRNLARSRALTFTFSTQYALTKELKPLKCIMPYMNEVVHQTAQPHTGAHQDSKRQLMGLGAAHHREQGCSSRCGCAFHMHACRSATTTSVRHFHAEQVGTKLDSRLHDCTRSATREWSSSRGPCGGGCCGEFHACLQPCQCSRGLYTASTPITARRNYTTITYLQNHGMGQGLGNG